MDNWQATLLLGLPLISVPKVCRLEMSRIIECGVRNPRILHCPHAQPRSSLAFACCGQSRRTSIPPPITFDT